MAVAFDMYHAVREMNHLNSLPESAGRIFGNPLKIVVHLKKFIFAGFV